MSQVFSKLEDEIIACLENRKISEELISVCKEARAEFLSLEDKVIQEEDILNGLKLFSACDNSAVILENAIPQLAEAKKRDDNPISLEKIEDILVAISQIGENVLSVTDTPESKSFVIKQIRELSLYLQEIAEQKGLLESIDKRIEKTPYELRKSIAERVTLHRS